MRIRSIFATALIAISTLSIPAQATNPQFVKVSDWPAGVDPSTNLSRGGTGASRIATNADGSVVVFSDHSLFNNYSWNGNFATQGPNMVGPRLYISRDSGATFAPVLGAPMADWGSVDMSEDGSKIVAIHQDAHIANNAKVSGPGAWLSTDGGVTFTNMGQFRQGATNTWDVSMSGDGGLIIVTEDTGSYIPHYYRASTMTWAPLNLPAAPWRTVSISRDGTMAVLCQEDGLYVSRDSGATFTKEISHNEGCGPLALSGDGNTIVIGRFAQPNKKVFHYAGNGSWTLAHTIGGVSQWHSTASVSISNDGQVITIGDYRSNPNLVYISRDRGVTFSPLVEGTPASYQPIGEVYVSLDGGRIYALHADGVFRLNLTPAVLPSLAQPVVAATPYDGPVVMASQLRVSAGAEAVINGSQLDRVTGVEVGGQAGQVIALASDQLRIKLPSGLTPGLHNLTLRGSFGTLVAQGALRVSAIQGSAKVWTKRLGPTEAKVFANLPSASTNVSVTLNGKALTDLTISAQSNQGRVALAKGRNVIEIFVNGVRTWRAVYTVR